MQFLQNKNKKQKQNKKPKQFIAHTNPKLTFLIKTKDHSKLKNVFILKTEPKSNKIVQKNSAHP